MADGWQEFLPSRMQATWIVATRDVWERAVDWLPAEQADLIESELAAHPRAEKVTIAFARSDAEDVQRVVDDMEWTMKRGREVEA